MHIIKQLHKNIKKKLDKNVAKLMHNYSCMSNIIF